jgi:hypothetical protein
MCVIIAAMLACGLALRGRPPMLLPNRAYRAMWAGHGELATAAMRPFLQHMRLRPYAVYSVLDAALSAWVFAQVYNAATAAARFGAAAVLSVVLCWGFDLYMRRRFAAGGVLSPSPAAMPIRCHNRWQH